MFRELVSHLRLKFQATLERDLERDAEEGPWLSGPWMLRAEQTPSIPSRLERKVQNTGSQKRGPAGPAPVDAPAGVARHEAPTGVVGAAVTSELNTSIPAEAAEATTGLSQEINAVYDSYKRGETGIEGLYEALRLQAKNLVSRRLREFNPALAHDIATRAVLNLEGFNGSSQFSTWFVTIARNEINRELGSRVTERNRLVSFNRDVSLDDEPRGQLPRQLHARIDIELLSRRLPEAQADVLRRRGTGCTLEEISHDTGEPLGTVRSRYERAKARIKKLVRPRI